MRQILQHFRTGEIELTEVPLPRLRPGHLLICSSCSLISAGTERMLAEFAKANLLSKAKKQPEKVKQVLEKLKTDGLASTIEAVKSRLDEPMPLGYCNAGTIMDIGKGVAGFRPGDRVMSNGHHAEAVCVPANLCAKIPDSVSDEEAAFTVLAAVGLQGIRLAEPTLGETVVVVGLGLVGLMTAQMLAANGCRVLGFDMNAQRVGLAQHLSESHGSTTGSRFEALSDGLDPVLCAMDSTQGRGADAVLITASTSSNDPVHQAALMCRKRGRIIVVGVTGMDLRRSDFYEKELSFQVSCSYGPGRYDPSYEEKGHDYPLGYVRWTEQRNFEAVLQLMSSGKLDVRPLISHRFPFDRAVNAYDLIVSKREPSLGILLNYANTSLREKGSSQADQVNVLKTVSLSHPQQNTERITVGVIGAGGFAKRVLLPSLKKSGAYLKTIASTRGFSGAHLGKQFGFENTTTDYQSLLDDPEIQAVFITTRHDQHANQVVQALSAQKHVFVEKPLALNKEELNTIFASLISGYPNTVTDASSSLLLHVGFNRRFAPHVQKMKQLLSQRTQPLAMVMTVNAGEIPQDHWVQDPDVGGGRIIGEACHFVDLFTFLADSTILSVCGQTMGRSNDRYWDDIASLTAHFADGSVGTVHYFANGHRRYPKERLEVFSEGRVLLVDNFRRLSGYGWPTFHKMRLWKQDKGHETQIRRFLSAIQQADGPLIPAAQLYNVTATTFAAVEAAQTGQSLGVAQL